MGTRIVKINPTRKIVVWLVATMSLIVEMGNASHLLSIAMVVMIAIMDMMRGIALLLLAGVMSLGAIMANVSQEIGIAMDTTNAVITRMSSTVVAPIVNFSAQVDIASLITCAVIEDLTAMMVLMNTIATYHLLEGSLALTGKGLAKMGTNAFDLMLGAMDTWIAMIYQMKLIAENPLLVTISSC